MSTVIEVDVVQVSDDTRRLDIVDDEWWALLAPGRYELRFVESVTDLTGRELYEIYAAAFITQCNCMVEWWVNLEQGDRDVWDTMAQKLLLKQGDNDGTSL